MNFQFACQKHKENNKELKILSHSFDSDHMFYVRKIIWIQQTENLHVKVNENIHMFCRPWFSNITSNIYFGKEKK